MQNVSFKSVEEFLDFLPDDELKIVELLRSLILNCIPEVTEKLSYNVPFYKRHKSICFIWPSSILWGTRKTYTGVRFGFAKGYLLQDESNYLDKTNRKQFYMMDFNSVNEIDIDLFKSYLFEAVRIDEQMHNGTIKK